LATDLPFGALKQLGISKKSNLISDGLVMLDLFSRRRAVPPNTDKSEDGIARIWG
jgi:hypothetical protein